MERLSLKMAQLEEKRLGASEILYLFSELFKAGLENYYPEASDYLLENGYLLTNGTIIDYPLNESIFLNEIYEECLFYYTKTNEPINVLEETEDVSPATNENYKLSELLKTFREMKPFIDLDDVEIKPLNPLKSAVYFKFMKGKHIYDGRASFQANRINLIIEKAHERTLEPFMIYQNIQWPNLKTVLLDFYRNVI